jgi:hypothetical protein
MTPEQLRVAADACDRKAEHVFNLGFHRHDEARRLWDRAVALRLRANAIEDQRNATQQH